MAGTLAGGKLAGQTNKKKYGEDFYMRIGSIGGKKGKTGGFYKATPCEDSNCFYNESEPTHLVRQCNGAKGGYKSRRTKKR